MIDELCAKARSKMEDTLHSLERDLTSISTGRANPELLNTIRVDSYGSSMPLTQVASISVPDSTTLSIQAWDKDSVKPIEKAIIDANLGFNPMCDGQLIRINVPKLSEERRLEMSKLAKKYGEDKKIAIRNGRRDILDELKKNEKDAGISKDQIHDFGDMVQKITDEFVKKIDDMVSQKERDLMVV
jgi:ribosome recycling factor